MADETLTQERIKELMVYDPDTGVLTWRVHRGGRARAGTVVGIRHPEGYRLVKVDRRATNAHRIAVLYMTGAWPNDQVDHINGDKDDNRWSNLRLATASQNCVNRTRPNTVGEGLRGVLKTGNRYQAAICIRENGKKRRIHLGMFATADEAHQAYLAAARKLHGEFLPVN